MDESNGLLSLPRLRLARNAVYDDNNATPTAGPSRLRDDDEELTPRIPIQNNLATTTPYPSDTPAARLRALLAKVPNDTPRANPPVPSSPSETSSDFYPSYLNTTNNPHQSLKELFSHALRDPGDTPERPRRRRNSIDLSEVDASPRLDRAQKERAKTRGKRKSLSDEELEKANSERMCYLYLQKLTQAESSQHYSQATTFHTLRQRLANSQFDLDLKDVAPPTDREFMIVRI